MEFTEEEVIKLLEELPYKQLLALPGFKEAIEWHYEDRLKEIQNGALPIANEHEKLINVVELATNLAHDGVLSLYNDNVYRKDKNGDTRYKPKVQLMFDELYDEFYNKIIECEVKKGDNNGE